MNDTLGSINVLMIQSQNGSYSQDDLDTIAGEMEDLLASMADLMNSQDSNGKYIFAGTNASSPAFSIGSDGRYKYDGNESQSNAQIGDNIYVATNDSGKKIFEDVWTRNTFSVTSGAADFEFSISDQDTFDTFINDRYRALVPSQNSFTLTTDGAGGYAVLDSGGGTLASGTYQAGQPITFNGMEFTLTGVPGSSIDFEFDQPTRDNVLNQVQEAINALRDTSLTSVQRNEFIASAFTSIENTQTSMGTASSSVGARINTIDNRTEYSASKKIFNQQAQENIGGLDVYKATTELQLSESALQASQLLFQRVSSLSLFNSI
jgi:flagellar hook-associated protein 3 FlgL